MYAGLQHAKGEYVCIVDADLQQSPTVVNTMYEKLENDENIDCVAACQVQRNENKVQSWFKNCFYKLINRISEVDFKTGASDFRMFRREVANSLSSINEYHRFFKGIFGYVGFNTEYIEYSAEDRQAGISKWNLFKLFKYAFEGIISFSSFPLKIASVCGITASVSSMIYLIYIVIKKIFFDINVSGFATIVVLVLFLGGLQLFGLGLLGEYVGRIYEQSKNRPIYMLKEEINCTKFE